MITRHRSAWLGPARGVSPPRSHCIGRNLVQIGVANVEESDLFEVGHGDAPSPLQVHVEPVLSMTGRGRIGGIAGGELRLRIGQVLGGLERERGGNTLSDDFMTEAVRCRG